MRRFVASAVRETRFLRNASFASAAFRGKLVVEEVFPFPVKALKEDPADTHQTLLTDLKNAASSDGSSANPFTGTGIHGIGISEEFGGLDLNQFAHMSTVEFCASTLNSSSAFARLLAEHACLVRQVLNEATPEQKGRLLPGMSDGSILIGWAVDEAGALPDVSLTRTTATPTEEEGKYLLNGTKALRFAASETATHYLVMAKFKTQTMVDDSPVLVERLTFFIIDVKSPGVTVKDQSVSLTNVEVSTNELVGVAGEAYALYMKAMMSTQPIVAAAVIGTIRKILNQKLLSTVVPIEMMALLRAHLLALENVAATVGLNQDAKAEDLLVESCALVMMCHRMTKFVATNIGAEMIERGALEELYENMRLLLPLSFVRQVAGCCGVEDFGVNFTRTSTLDVMQQRATRGVGFIEKLPPLKECKDMSSKVEALTLRLTNATEKIFVKNGPSARLRQLLLHRLSESNALLYSAVCTLSRAQRLAGKSDLALARLWVDFAIGEATTLCEECLNVGECADEAHGRLASEVLDQYIKVSA